MLQAPSAILSSSPIPFPFFRSGARGCTQSTACCARRLTKRGVRESMPRCRISRTGVGGAPLALSSAPSPPPWRRGQVLGFHQTSQHLSSDLSFVSAATAHTLDRSRRRAGSRIQEQRSVAQEVKVAGYRQDERHWPRDTSESARRGPRIRPHATVTAFVGLLGCIGCL